jgi:hypothetical protein
LLSAHGFGVAQAVQLFSGSKRMRDGIGIVGRAARSRRQRRPGFDTHPFGVLLNPR